MRGTVTRSLAAALLLSLLGAMPAGAAFTDGLRRAGNGATAADVFAPRTVEMPRVSGTPEQGRITQGTLGNWERQPERFAVRWLRCDASDCRAIDGATATSYTPVAADLGARLRIEVTATNAGGSTVAVSEPSPPVGAARPVIVTPPSATGTAMRGERLSASPGTWTGAESFAYEWRRCPATGDDACESISGATTATYQATAADVGQRVRVAVHATNRGGTATALSAPAGPIVERTPERVYLLAVRQDSPAALYHFNDGGAWDSSGYGRHASPKNVTFGESGALAGSTAARMNGTDSYLDLQWSPTCGAAGFTYESWVRWESGRAYERIFDFGDAPGGSFLALTPRFGAGVEQMWPMVWVGGAGWDLAGAPPLPTGGWKHVALTFAADRRVTLYVDGLARSTGVSPWTVAQVGCRPNNWIGRSMYPADPYFGGLQDDIAIYDRALSAGRVAAHFAARLG